MKWGHIFFEVFALYVKLAFVLLAYFGTRFIIAEKRPSRNPPFTKQIGGYLGCIAIVAVIAWFASASWEGEDEERHVVSTDYNRGATVFLALIIPALFGVADGYATSEKFPKTSHSNYDDM